MFGGAIARGEQQLGQGATTAGKFFGQVAADNGFNQYQDAANKIMHGDPQATTIGPDGQPQQDLGYLGLKGRAALDARPKVSQQLDELQKRISGDMVTPEMQLQFDNYSRRYRTSIDAQIGSHADTQANTWYTEVNQSSAALAKEHIANNAGNDDMFLHGLQDLKMAYAKQADLAGGGDQLKQAALDRATREAYTTRVETIAATDPAAALKMADANKVQLGAAYGELRDKLQTRADKQIGESVGDQAWKSGAGSATHAYNPATGKFDLPAGAGAGGRPGDKVAPPVYDAQGNPVPQGDRAPDQTNFNDAKKALLLTPQEQALYQRHLTNLNGPGGVHNANGSISTLYQTSVEVNGKTYNIPTVYDGKILPPNEALERAKAEGIDKFPSYPDEATAERRYNQMHDYMEKDTGAYLSARKQAQAAPTSGDAASVVRHFENPAGPWTNAHWDVNHWRVGYSSDTVTRADGTVEPVTATTTVTHADAERDLARRVGLSQGQIKTSIGNEAWGKLSPQAQAALTSVTYNYGHLPPELVAPAQSGDPAALARAVAGLGSNPDRRRQEAAGITGGFTLSGPAAVAGAPTMQMPRAGQAEPEENQPPILRSLAEQRASAMGAIMDNPDLNFDQRRHALAYVEQQYSGRTTENSVEKQTLESTVPNLILAKENGVENVNIPWDRVQAAMPPAKFQKWKDEADIADQTGTAIKALRWSSPDDVASMQRDIESGQGVLSEAMRAHSRSATTGPGVAGANPDATEDEAMRFRLRQGMARQFEAALTRRQALLVGPEADPAQYVADHPVVAAARAKLDPSQPATYQAYAAAVLGVEEHVGAANPQIYDKGQAERLAARWADPTKMGGGAAVADDIKREAQKWGDYWPQIYAQVAPKTNAMIRVIGAGTQNGADKQLLEAQGVKDEELLKGHDDPEAKRKDINYAVADNLKTIARTFPGSQRSQTMADLQGVAERLTIIRASGATDQNISTLAKGAVDDIVNFKYDFQNSYRIPKNPAFQPSVIQAGVVEAKRQLGNPEALNVPGGDPDSGPLSLLSKQDQQRRGLPQDYLSSETAEGLRNDGVWMTDPHEKGLVLVQPDGFAVRRPDGTALMLTWGQLRTLGTQKGAMGRANEEVYRASAPPPSVSVQP